MNLRFFIARGIKSAIRGNKDHSNKVVLLALLLDLFLNSDTQGSTLTIAIAYKGNGVIRILLGVVFLEFGQEINGFLHVKLSVMDDTSWPFTEAETWVVIPYEIITLLCKFLSNMSEFANICPIPMASMISEWFN